MKGVGGGVGEEEEKECGDDEKVGKVDRWCGLYTQARVKPTAYDPG